MRIKSPILSCGTIGASEAVARAGRGELQLVDCTWVPGDKSLETGHLSHTTAVLDTNTIKTLNVNARTPDVLASHFEAAGISASPQIAIYDRAGLFSSTWGWWMLQELGYTCVVVQGWAEEAAASAPVSATLSPREPHAVTATLADILAATDATQIIDARGPGRFHGTEPEPRAGVRSGHIPGSTNLPMSRIKSGNRFITPAETFVIIKELGIDITAPIITTCGSGITASALAFVLSRAGATDIRVYMGSWAEYGAFDHPIAT